VSDYRLYAADEPYVAGYYAWTYLGEELDRAEVEARLDELLGLELAA